MILILGQSRVAFAMARDHLFPRPLARTHERHGTPHRITLITGALVALLAGFVPIVDLAELVNIGTLFAFMLVAAGVWLLRSADPDRPRPFRVPFVPLFPLVTVALCIWLMTSLDGVTWLRFFAWMALGLVVYFLWARHRSVVGHARERDPGLEDAR
jgi:APA family basic amino acid/polyamine antiporter